jgi:hypothetical protein
MTVLGL